MVGVLRGSGGELGISGSELRESGGDSEQTSELVVISKKLRDYN
jgi:hypothetical protein